MQLVGAIAKLTSKADDLANDELSDTARVGKGGVENGDTMAGGVIEINLVGTDAEAADDQQVLGLAEDLLAQSGLGANADDVNVAVEKKNTFC